MTYVEGDPGHITAHNADRADVVTLVSDWAVTGVTLPATAVLGGTTHVDDHNDVAAALTTIRAKMVADGETVATLDLPDTAVVGATTHIADHNELAAALTTLKAISPGDLKLITSATGTAVSSLSINGCFSAAYDHYLIMRNLLGSTTNAGIDIRLRVSGVDASGADYRWQRVYTASTTVGGSRSTGVTSAAHALGYAEATSFGFSRTWISNPFATARTTLWTDHSYDADADIYLFSRVQAHDLATSYDGFTVIPDAGTITGTIYVYGLAV